MEHCKYQHTQHDHGTLQDDEFRLFAHEFAPPATGKLWDTVDTSNVDAQEGSDDGEDEATERCFVEECHCFGGQLVAAVVGTDGILGEKDAKARQNDNLEDNTCDHEVRSDV